MNCAETHLGGEGVLVLLLATIVTSIRQLLAVCDITQTYGLIDAWCSVAYL